MKIVNIALTALLMAGLSTACVKEDHSDCRNIYSLALSYMGDGQTEIFDQKIDRVHMYVFDHQNNCVTSKQLSSSDVQARLTALPRLEPGDYRIVCIGNAYKTKVENLSSGNMEQVVFTSSDYAEGKVVAGNDPLYWSSTDYTIAPYDTYRLPETRVANFASSHFDISVEVEGVPAVGRSSDYPRIELSGVSPVTDFTNKAKGEAATYVLQGKHDGASTLTSVTNIMRHGNHEDVSLNVKSADGTVMASVNFAEHIAKYDIDVTKHECLIPFKVEFKSIGVSITVPTWFIENIQTEF